MIKSVLVVISVIGVAIAQHSNSQRDNQDSTAARKNLDLIHPNGTKVHSEIYNKHDKNRIVFPNEETNKNRLPTHDRTPVTGEGCDENELLYPGDNEGDWVCDCKPGYLHYPLTSKCYEAYTQGPCKREQLLILDSRTSNSIPKCVHNKCGKGMVEFQTQCFTLHEEGGCQQYKTTLGRPVVLSVNPTTNGLICATEDLAIECDKCCVGRNGNVVPPGYVCERPSPTVPAQRPQQVQPRPDQATPLRPEQFNSQQNPATSQNSRQPQPQVQPTYSQGSPSSQPSRPVQSNLQFPTTQSPQRLSVPSQGIQAPHQNTQTQTQQQTQQGSGQQAQYQSQGQQTESPYLQQPSQAQIQAQQNQIQSLGQVVVQRVDEVIQNSQGKQGPQPLTDAQKAGQRVLSSASASVASDLI